MEELQAKHRKEQRELQSRITQKKKSATKRSRKGVNDECERWQRELLDRQQAEIAESNGDVGPPTEDLDNLHVDDNDPTTNKDAGATIADVPPSLQDGTESPAVLLETRTAKKPNRQKARLARRAAEREAEADAAAAEAANQVDHRGNEKEAMQAVFTRLGLKERDIAPDGHCLYAAVAAQLPENCSEKGDNTSGSVKIPSKNTGYRGVRETAGKFILSNGDDFAPFIEEPLEQYVKKIMFTAEWGGQLELQAIARAYGVEIRVIQGDGRIEKFEPGDDKSKDNSTIWLAYYRHSYGLGEHYNALTPKA